MSPINDPLIQDQTNSSRDTGHTRTHESEYDLPPAAQHILNRLETKPAPAMRRCYSMDSIREQHSPIDYLPVITPSPHSKEMIHGRMWQAHSGTLALGVVSVIHGMGEHSGCYQDLAHALNKRGIHVISFDHRGHGFSQGPRGVVEHFDQLHQDIRHNLTFAQRLFPHLPHRILAHSMGGGLILDHLHRFGDEDHLIRIEKVLVTSPWIRLCTPVPAPLTFLANTIDKCMRNFTLNTDLKVKPNPNRVPLVDPLCHGRISPRWYSGAENAGTRLIKTAVSFPPRHKDRVTLMHCKTDAVTSHAITAEFASLAKTRFVELDAFGHSPHTTNKKELFLEKVIEELMGQSRAAQSLETGRNHGNEHE